MKQDYNFDVDKIKSLSNEEKVSRKKDLNTFLETGFPNKQNEDWKFTDLNAILNKNFDMVNYFFRISCKINFYRHCFINVDYGIGKWLLYTDSNSIWNVIYNLIDLFTTD